MRWDVAALVAADFLPRVNVIHAAATPRDTFYTRHGKRALDIVVALIALIVTLPINLVLALLTLIDVGRPIFFRQERVGKDGEIFTILKFRNMRETRDERGELLPPEQRVTKLGVFVRRTSLDELLNFIPVLTGKMSLIGPRPLPTEYAARYSRRHAARLAVRPGLECPPRQRTGRDRGWHEQFEDDVWYVENVSLKTDLMLCLRLVQYTLNRSGVGHPERGQIDVSRALTPATNFKTTGSRDRGTFMGYNFEGQAINLDEVPQHYIDAVVNQRPALEPAAA